MVVQSTVCTWLQNNETVFRVHHSPVESQRGHQFLLGIHLVRGSLQEADCDLVPLLSLWEVLGYEV